MEEKACLDCLITENWPEVGLQRAGRFFHHLLWQHPQKNLVERSVRPLVIARKISGGSRSPKGSDTRMDLFSLFGIWAAQGLNPFFQCLAELSHESSLR